MNRKRRVDRRALIIMLLLLMLVVVLGLGTTLAYFSAKNDASTSFRMRSVSLDLSEPGWCHPGGATVVPDTVMVKDPTIKATGDDCYLRVRLLVIDVDTGERVTDGHRLDAILGTLWFDSSYGNSGEPTLSEDGHYTTADLLSLERAGRVVSLLDVVSGNDASQVDPFTSVELVDAPAGLYTFEYRGILAHGDDSVRLFTHVVIPSDMDVEGLGDYSVRIWAEGIQSDGFDGQDAAMKALEDAYPSADDECGETA